MPLYSEEVQEIMEKIPHRLLKIGLSIIFVIISILLIGSFLFKYPEKVLTSVTLITLNPPISLHAQTTTPIQKLFVREKDSVQKKQVVVLLENTANYTDIQTLNEKLKIYATINKWDSLVLTNKQNYLQVGELQEFYNQFVKSWNSFHEFIKLNYYPKKIALLKCQIIQQQHEYQEMLKQDRLQKKNYLLAQNQFQRDSSFFSHYNEIAMSLQEFNQKEQVYIKEAIVYSDFCKTLRAVNYSISELQNEIINLQLEQEKELIHYRNILDENYNLLSEHLKQWEEKYIIKAPISGIITFTKNIKENQLIKKEESFITIIPLEPSEIVGYASIDMNSIGKVKYGQQVNIKLYGFPYIEYGTIKGVVTNVSMVPEENKKYTVNINLLEGMQSSLKKELEFVQKMEGTAEIITANRRLLTRIIPPLQALIDE